MQLEAVVRRIKLLTSADRDTKILVFSSWGDVLDVLSHALRENSIPFAYAQNAQKLAAAIRELQQTIQPTSSSAVRDRKHLQTLLLPIKQGANGLNLTEAQHVILVEPLLDPAVEAQAVSRVHRIGQKRKTYVHRFVVKSSVEENVYKLNRERAQNVDLSALGASRASIPDQQFTIRDVALLLEKWWTEKGATTTPSS